MDNPRGSPEGNPENEPEGNPKSDREIDPNRGCDEDPSNDPDGDPGSDPESALAEMKGGSYRTTCRLRINGKSQDSKKEESACDDQDKNVRKAMQDKGRSATINDSGREQLLRASRNDIGRR